MEIEVITFVLLLSTFISRLGRDVRCKSKGLSKGKSSREISVQYAHRHAKAFERFARQSIVQEVWFVKSGVCWLGQSARFANTYSSSQERAQSDLLLSTFRVLAARLDVRVEYLRLNKNELMGCNIICEVGAWLPNSKLSRTHHKSCTPFLAYLE